jgi:hypothetical protein
MAKQYYKNIGKVICPALENREVVFLMSGFKHLIYKDKKFRPVAEQLRRFESLYFAKQIIESAEVVDQYRKGRDDLIPAQFWAFDKKIYDQEIRVVLRKIGVGPIHFFSVRSRKNTKPPEGGM